MTALFTAQRSHYHVFSLPSELLDNLTPRNLFSQVEESRAPSPEPIIAASGQRACNVCLGVSFRDVDEQRAHFKSDWHRYNVKTRLNGSKPVSEAEFNQLVEGLQVDDSLSGSASSSEDDDDSDAVNTLVSKTRKLDTRSPSPDAKRQAPQTALAWFHTPPSTQLGIYKAIFPLKTETSNWVEEVRDLQLPREGGRTWAMFMVAGGHFAGAVVRVSKDQDDEDKEQTTKSKKKPKKPKPETEVLLHKTFHRYTTRRKQGGSQSVNDNAKGPAKSAGAQLRRYGEQALRDDIRGLLADWAEDLHGCERIWIRASTSNRRVFFDYDDAVIQKGDERLRTFPFPTRRPTQSEIARCLQELTKIKVTHFTEDELKAQDEAYLASLPKPKPVPPVSTSTEPRVKPQPIKLSKEEEILREKWSRLLEMVNKGRLEPLKAFWEREREAIGGIDAPIPEWAGERYSTLLQVATSGGNADVVHWLLDSARADPTILVASPAAAEEANKPCSDAATASSARGRTAYDLAKTKEIRDVFRRCAAAHLNWWDWLGSGHVPSILSQDMEDEQEQKKKVRRKGLKDKLKERAGKEKDEEHADPVPEVAPASAKKPSTVNPNVHRLGGAGGSGEGVAGLTAEMKAKVEREQRARAAEARLKMLGGPK
ncbi:cytoplasmic protein [Coprinopsis sp. MPI-PUGE-AT-0042]|nr:cytoplasmic protein [Coprinopsis sp. MPI-PUGE-AT-0042]